MIQHKSTIKKIKSTLVLADDPNDNGLAALLSILRFHDDYSTLEELRILSDTNEAGSTLFGLQQAAIKCGYQCKGYKLDTEALKECKHPAILSMTAQQQDFVVFYGTYTVGNQLMYVLKDITKGLVFLNQRQLTKLWGTNFCLVIEPPKDKRPVAPLKKSSVFALLKQEPALVYTIAFFAMLVAALLILPDRKSVV